MWFHLLLNEIKIFPYGRSFSSCYKLRTKENFRFPIRNQTSDLWIPRSDAVPLSFRELCGERGHFWIHTWHASCILLGPAMSKASRQRVCYRRASRASIDQSLLKLRRRHRFQNLWRANTILAVEDRWKSNSVLIQVSIFNLLRIQEFRNVLEDVLSSSGSGFKQYSLIHRIISNVHRIFYLVFIQLSLNAPGEVLKGNAFA